MFHINRFLVFFAAATLLFIVGYAFVLMIFPGQSLQAFLEFLAPEQNRENGLIETLQHLVLLSLIFVLAAQLISSKTFNQRLFFTGATALMAFIFLEETDYLMNYIEKLFGMQHYEISAGGFRNLHNTEHYFSLHKLAYWCMSISTLIFAVWCLVKKTALTARKSHLYFILVTWLCIQTGLSLAGQFYLNQKSGFERQVVNETLELHLYASWLFLVCIINRSTILPDPRAEFEDAFQ